MESTHAWTRAGLENNALLHSRVKSMTIFALSLFCYGPFKRFGGVIVDAPEI